MLRTPHYLCQTVEGAFPVCQVDTSEVVFSRSFQQRFKLHHILMRHVLFTQWLGHYSSLSRKSSVSRNHSCLRSLGSRVSPPHLTQVLSLVPRQSSQDLLEQSMRVMRHSSQKYTLGYREGFVTLTGCPHHRHV